MWNQPYLNMRLAILSGCILLGAFITGCATAPHISSLPKCGPDGKPHTGGPQYALLDMRTSRDGLVRVLDSKAFCPKRSCNHNNIVLTPGEHKVIFTYLKSYSVLGPGGRDPVKLKFEVKSGETYRAIVKVAAFTWSYTCSIEEVSTGRKLAQIENCDHNDIRWPAMNEVFDVYGGKQQYVDTQCYR